MTGRRNPVEAAWDRTLQTLGPPPAEASVTSPTYRTLADALDAARMVMAGMGGGDVVVEDCAGHEIWREHVDGRGQAHPVRAPGAAREERHAD